MKRLTCSQRVQVVRGLYRLGEHSLGEQLQEGYLFLAETEEEADHFDRACNNVRYEITPAGRDALHPQEGS